MPSFAIIVPPVIVREDGLSFSSPGCSFFSPLDMMIDFPLLVPSTFKLALSPIAPITSSAPAFSSTGVNPFTLTSTLNLLVPSKVSSSFFPSCTVKTRPAELFIFTSINLSFASSASIIICPVNSTPGPLSLLISNALLLFIIIVPLSASRI